MSLDVGIEYWPGYDGNEVGRGGDGRKQEGQWRRVQVPLLIKPDKSVDPVGVRSALRKHSATQS